MVSATERDWDFGLSVAVIGERGVGKSMAIACTQSTPVQGAESGLWKDDFGASVKVHFYASRGSTYRVHLWEIPGAPRYVSSAGRYASIASGIMFMFDLNRRVSLDRLEEWLAAVQEAGLKVPRVLVGNKVDAAADEGVRVSAEDIDDFCTKHDLQYFEASALENRGITEATSVLLAQVINRIPNPPESSLLLHQRVQIGRRLAQNEQYREALFDVTKSDSG